MDAPHTLDEKEANIVSHTVMGSPFLVSMEDLEQKNAQLDMEKAQLATEIVRLNGELEAARKEIASLRRSRTRTLTKKGKP